MNSHEDLALKTARASPCKKRKVGAVFTQDDRVINVAYNYNADPDNNKCEDECGDTLSTVVHAEVSVLQNISNKIKSDFSSYTMYITHSPCNNCKDYIDSFAKRYNIKIIIKVVEQFMKFDTDKLRYDLIPPSAMKALAEVLTYGAKKYKPNNWRNGDKDRYIAALYRHLEAWRAGEQKDDESGMIHLAHALTNVAFLIELEKTDGNE